MNQTRSAGSPPAAASRYAKLYTDQDAVLFDAARPVILNGIEDIVTRPDLADRAVFLTLEPIPEEQLRPQAELWAAFEAERPAHPRHASRCSGRGSDACRRPICRGSSGAA